jgi:alkanesulfonate monooxygenase SsuD/methylene tetrahydromethanopterin reductase-like flavin-dependent oxidoreductase (luciferase family)
MVAQVDAMSGGRISLGLGASWYEAEHRAYGIPFPPAADRFEQLEEQLAIVRGIWTTPDGELFEFDGKWYQLASCPALPKPVQKPAPPIVVGGRGLRRTPHIAALFADELNVSPASSPQQAKEMFEHADEACNTVGRDPRTLRRTVMVTVVCGEHRADIDRRLAHPGAAQTDVCGTPAQVGDALRAHEEAGSEMAYLRLVDLHDVDHIALIGDALVDELR